MVIAIIQARIGSTRLPAKVMKSIGGKTLLELYVNRVRPSKKTDRIVVATTTNPNDDVIVDLCQKKKIDFFRGSEEDLLDRYYECAKKYKADTVLRITSDDPFVDYEVIDRGITIFKQNRVDFVTNHFSPTYPEGLDIEIYSFEALERSWKEAKRPSEREHVFPYIENNQDKFKIINFEQDKDNSHLRWTIDHQCDFDMTKLIYSYLYKDKEVFLQQDILMLLEKHPEIEKMNSHIKRKEGVNKSIEKEKAAMADNTSLVNPSKYLGNELEYVKKVLCSESWSATGGSWNQSLEQQLAKRIGVKYAVAFNSGTSTIHAALEAAGVGPGDEVISPTLTVIMDSTATFLANAIPVYADINPDDFTIDPKDVERKITKKTKAIIAVSIYGLPCDMDPIMALAKKHNLIVIEDNAQCFLSTYKGRMAGTIGHCASYSFENTKHVSCGEGGAIITNDEKLAEMVRKIGGHGFKNLRAEEGRVRLNADVFQSPDYLRHDVLGWNYRLSEFNAAVALAQLERVDELVDLRIKSARIFIDVMKECSFLKPQACPEGRTNSFYTLGVVYEGDENIGVSWKDFRKEYVNAGGDGIYGAWAVPYLEPMVATRQFAKRCPWVYENISYAPGLCPVAERVQKKIMQFKTNYRDINLAEKKAEILQTMIKKYK